MSRYRLRKRARLVANAAHVRTAQYCFGAFAHFTSSQKPLRRTEKCVFEHNVRVSVLSTIFIWNILRSSKCSAGLFADYDVMKECNFITLYFHTKDFNLKFIWKMMRSLWLRTGKLRTRKQETLCHFQCMTTRDLPYASSVAYVSHFFWCSPVCTSTTSISDLVKSSFTALRFLTYYTSLLLIPRKKKHYNDAVSLSICMASNGRMVGEHSVGMDIEKSGRGLIEILSRHLPGGLRETTKIFR
jgi:hypothetical protein